MLLLTAAAVLVHGYHPAIEDAEIYLPGIKKLLDPALYPQNQGFFTAQTSRTLFPNLVAASVRLTHIPLDYVLFLGHLLSVFLLLLACWRIARLCFQDDLAAWGGTALVAGLLTIPVAGTALYILDQYLNTRSFSTFSILFAILASIEGKRLRAVLWFVFTALIHPLMVVFGLSYLLILFLLKRRVEPIGLGIGGALLFPLKWFPAISDSYVEALNQHSYLFLDRWAWYELVGALAPLAILAWFRAVGRRRGLPLLALLCTALIWFGALCFLAGVLLTIPRLAGLVSLQPLRSLHLIYIFLFLFAGGLLAQTVLRRHVWRWLLLFLPLCGGMFSAQRVLFPASPHIEWPGVAPENDWLRAFAWVRQDTPRDAYFALDPKYVTLAGEEAHGFRALAERSRMADNFKDAGPVSVSPGMADEWKRQVSALAHWREFQKDDFQRLHEAWGVGWVLVARSQASGLDCPYRNATLAVCRLE